MTQLYAQQSAQGIWTALGPPKSAAFALAQSLTVTYGDGTQDTLAAHVPAVTSAGTTQVDRTAAVWLLYVVQGDPTLRLVREMDQSTMSGAYAPLARVLADRVVPYQPDGGQAQSSTSGQSYLPLSVTNNSSTQSIGGSGTAPVPTSSTDYVVQCTLGGSTASAVWNALADKTSFSDVQVLFAGAEIDADIDQQSAGAWSSSNISCWFRLQRPIAASGTDSGYQLRVGGGARSSPKRNWANIYPLSDDFSSWNSALWGSQPSSATLAGGVLTISVGAGAGRPSLQSAVSYGTGYALVCRTILPSYALGQENIVGFLAAANAVPWQVATSQGSLSSTTWLARQVAADATDVTAAMEALDGAYHVFTVARNADGSMRAWRDAGSAGTCSTKNSTAALYASLAPASNPGAAALSATYDWVKVRPYLSPEPTVSAGTLQSAGALVWQPITDSSGSVLVDSSGNPILALTTL